MLEVLNCTKCGAEWDTHTCISEEGAKPDVGDITICSSCGTPHKFIESLDVVAIGPDELGELDLEDLVAVLRTQVTIFKDC